MILVKRLYIDKYRRWHDAIIERAQLRDASLLVYKERHHIVPRCLGGNNSKANLVALTAEEHFVIHQLLVKLYPEEKKLVHAAFRMTFGSNTNKRSNNKLYGWIRKAHAEAASEFMTGKTHAVGAKFTRPPDYCEMLRQRMLNNNYAKGKKKPPRTTMHRENQSKAMANPRVKAKHSKAVKRAMARPAVKANQSEGVRLWWERGGVNLPPERRSEIARNAAIARWAGKRMPNPEKAMA